MNIDELSKFINLKSTIEQFGYPKNNKSFVYIDCSICSKQRPIKVQSFKNKLKLGRGTLCSSCGTKASWEKPGRREKYEKLWEDPEYRKEQSEKRKKTWEDSEYRLRHSQGCLNSYINDPNRRVLLSKKSKETWDIPGYRKSQSLTRKKLWEDPEYRKKQSEFKTPEWRESQSKKQKEVGENPEYRKNQSQKQKEIWEDPEYRKKQSQKQKEVWDTPGYRETQSQKQKEVWRNPEYRSDRKKLWENEAYKKNISDKLKKLWENESFRKHSSEASKKIWDIPGYRENIISKLKKLWEDPEYRKKASERSKKLWENESFVKKMGEARSKQLGRKSSIEVVTESLLESLGIESKSQVPVGPFLFDFYLPEHNVYIECQGEYWHSLPGRDSRDASKFTYLENFSPSSKILYLYEREFMNPSIVVSKISKFVTGETLEYEQESFNFSDITIREIDKVESKTFLNAFHYGGFGRSGKNMYGSFLEGKLVAVCKFSTVIRKEVATSMGISVSQVLELDRFCIHPNYQKKNFASWFLSRVSKKIFEKFENLTCLVSFSDQTYGHFGTIYTASNWKKIGTVQPSYYYVGEDGFILHKKTLYNRAVKMGMKEKDYADKFSYQKSFGREKTKFVLVKNL